MPRPKPYALLLAVAAFASASAESEFCPTVFAEYHRRQTATFGNETFVYEDGGSAKHIPFLTLSDDGATGTVVVGNGDAEGGVWHPMAASDDPEVVHFITHIMVKDQDDKVVALEALDPTVAAPATMTFSVPAGATSLTPFEWCNKHGLYQGDTVTIPAAATERNGESCGVSHYDEGAWDSVHADFMRLQKLAPFNSPEPFTEADGAKHTPYITLKDDGTASILVGDPASAIHPMNGSPDGVEEPHWITEVYVVDQSGDIVTMQSLDSTGVDRAEIDFEVPEGAESLTAYAWCNLHGLWKGPEVQVASASSEGNSATNARAGVVAVASLVAALGV